VRGGFAFVGGRLNRAAQLGTGEITQRENRPDYSAQFPESGFGGEIQGSTTVRYTHVGYEQARQTVAVLSQTLE
jgi:hypothetical protein